MTISTLDFMALQRLAEDRRMLLHRLAPLLLRASSGPKRAAEDKVRTKHRKAIRGQLRENGNHIVTRVMVLTLENTKNAK
jgi:hypothetical protein